MIAADNPVREFSPADKSVPVQNASATRLVLLIIAAGFLLRIVLAKAVGLGIDESYVAGVSRTLSLSYFDHPPLHFWIVGAWALVFGESPLALRFPFIVMFAGSTWLMYRLTARAYNERAGLWAVIAFSLSPFFTLSAGSWVLPDGPMVLFSLLAAQLMLRALSARDHARTALLFWAGSGAAFGLALLSKYLAVFYGFGALLYLITSREHRFWLARREPWVGVAIALVLFAPVIVWNVDNDFASFAFQGSRAAPEPIELRHFWQGIGGQFLYLLPWIGGALIVEIVKAGRRLSASDRLFLCLSVPTIATFFFLACLTRILPHWPMIGWLFAFPMLGYGITVVGATCAKLVRGTAIGTAVLLLGFFGVAAVQANYGLIARHVLPAKDPTVDLMDWKGLHAALAARDLLQPDVFVAAPHWIDAGKINYAIGRDVPVLCLNRDARQFAFVTDESEFENADAVLIGRHADQLSALAPRFERLEPLPDIVLMRNGEPAITLKVMRGTRFKPGV